MSTEQRRREGGGGEAGGGPRGEVARGLIGLAKSKFNFA
tara:strand:+ start:606 stop:722 length:117 start_codon:yes stop_codon:yes gene_type:complete